MRPRILFVVPTDYAALQRKGVDRLIRERDEGGYFERVVTIHTMARGERTIDLDDVHRIHEFPLGQSLGPDAGAGDRLAAPFQLIRMFRAAVRIARDERVDLVRATDPYLAGLVGWWVARALDVPLCVSLHADYGKRFQLSPTRGFGSMLRRLARAVPSFVMPRADMVLPIREHMIEWIVRAGARRDAIRVIPHGIDITPFTQPPAVDVRALLDIPADALVVSFAGRLSADNYAADMAEVIGRVARRRSNVVFVLLGDGPEATPLRQRLFEHAEVAHAVRMFPFQAYDVVVGLRRISTAALCLMGGFSLIEACAAGCPAVAYDVEWHRELVVDGVSGALVPEHDVAAAAAALERLIDDPVRAAAMGREARRRAFARHDIQVTSRIKQQCYTELLGMQRRA